MMSARYEVKTIGIVDAGEVWQSNRNFLKKLHFKHSNLKS